MTPTQEHLFKLLLEIDEICKKHDIEFFLEYGTTLGAVRHEGFIPWDNDLDISMTEENFDKFKRACAEELDESKRVFLDNRTDREFPQVFGHYIDKEACRISGHTTYWNRNLGQWIDVFCLLDLPKDEEEKRQAIFKYNAYDEFVNQSFRHCRWKPDEVIELYNSYVERAESVGREQVCRELESELFNQHYGDSDTFIITSAHAIPPVPYLPKAAYKTCKWANFEGHKFRIPGDYFEVMTHYYGDNYNLFPEEERVHVEMSHANIPARIYVDDYMRVLEKEKMLKVVADRKAVQMIEGNYATKYNAEFLKGKGYWIRYRIEKKIREQHIDLNSLMVPGDTKKLSILDELFNEYYKLQIDSSTLSWRVHLDIGDDFEYAAMFNLLYYRNDRTSLNWIFFIREWNRHELTEEMQVLRKIALQTREIRKQMEYKNYSEAQKALNWCHENAVGIPEIDIWDLKYALETEDDPEQLEKSLQKTEEMLNQKKVYAAFEDELLKLKADYYWKLDNRAMAQAIYDELKKTTRDGMILLDIRHKENM